MGLRYKKRYADTLDVVVGFGLRQQKSSSLVQVRGFQEGCHAISCLIRERMRLGMHFVVADAEGKSRIRSFSTCHEVIVVLPRLAFVFSVQLAMSG